MNTLLNDLNVQRLLMDGSVGLVIAGLHGFLLALSARLLGDPGPAHDGRMTLNPLRHLDIFSLLGFAVAQIGWIRPMTMRLSLSRSVIAVFVALAVTWALGRSVMASRGLILAITPPDFLLAMNGWTHSFARLSDRFVALNLLPVLSFSAAHLWRDRLPAVLKGVGLAGSALTLLVALAVKLWIWR